MRDFMHKFRVCILLSVILVPVSSAFAQSNIDNSISNLDSLAAQAAAATQEAADTQKQMDSMSDAAAANIAIALAKIKELEAQKVHDPGECNIWNKIEKLGTQSCSKRKAQSQNAQKANASLNQQIADYNALYNQIVRDLNTDLRLGNLKKDEAEAKAAALTEELNRARTELIGQFDEERGFFTPKTAELSVTLLGRIFGTVGNVLQGTGNQLLGTLISIFNAAWVVAIGIGILWIVWSSVIAAAGSGELMSKGKKTVFNIIRIVIGFALVVPSATTGYSLAQTGVMWIAIQGVGMAGNISDRFHEYLEGGGAVVPAKPPKVNGDLERIVPMNLAILQSEVCMYKLQDIVDQENKLNAKANDAAAEFSDVIAPSAPSANSSVGYSMNDGNTITFGTRKKDGSYNSECGSIAFDTDFSADITLREESRKLDELTGQRAGNPEELLMLQQLAVTEVLLQMQPMARSIASLDLKKLEENDPDGTLDSVRAQSSKGMASATMVFATIFDSVRAATMGDANVDRDQRMREFKELGWLYTPIAMLDAARTTYEVKISDNMPSVTGPNLDQITTITDENKKSLEAAVNLTASGYQTLAVAYLHELNKYSNLGNVSFQTTTSGEGLSSPDDPLGYLDFNMNQLGGFGGAVNEGVNAICDVGGSAMAFLSEGGKIMGDFFRGK